jgi:hypothetical protein
MVGIWNFILTPEPGFEPESEAPQASRISKLPHSGTGHYLPASADWYLNTFTGSTAASDCTFAIIIYASLELQQTCSQ